MNLSATPDSLADALDALDALIPVATKQYLRSLDEAGLRREQWGLGIAIRNVLGLAHDDAPLALWFRSRGSYTTAEMGDEILHAYWRRLRGPELPRPREGMPPADHATERAGR